MADKSGIEQVRDRALNAAREIERLCESGQPPQRLFPVLIRLLSTAVAAQAGAVWFPEDSGLPVKVHDSGSDAFRLDQEPAQRAWHQQLVGNTLATGESAFERAPGVDGPTSSRPSVAVAPLHRGTECVGAVELFFRNEPPAEAKIAVSQFLEQMCGFASRAIAGSDAAASNAWPRFLEQFEAFSLNLHRSLDTSTIAAIAANDARALLGCQRVSVAVQRGRRLKVTAISGQEGVNRKSNLVRAMHALMKAVSASREPLFISGQSESLLPSLTMLVTKYLEQNGSQVVAVVPLLEHPPEVANSDEKPNAGVPRKPRRLVGCLLADGPVDSRLTTHAADALRLTADHTAAALANSLTYRRVFLLPVWRFVGNRWDRFRGWTLLTALSLMALLATVIVGLVVVPWTYRAPAEGRLMPVTQREVFAPWDGDVKEIKVRDGQRVSKGDELLSISSHEIRTQILTTRNELNKKQEMVLALQAQMDQAGKKADRDEETRLQGELAATQIEVNGLEKQLDVWELRQTELTVRSPIDGVVATFRVEQLLNDRPVRRGDVLLEILQDEGEWQLELQVPEKRMGHILRAQRDLKDPARPVEFVLATTPELTLDGRLRTMATRTANSEKEGSIVEMTVDVDAEKLPARTIGAEVTARIDCGQRSLGYVLFGDFIEWLRRTLWW